MALGPENVLFPIEMSIFVNLGADNCIILQRSLQSPSKLSPFKSSSFNSGSLPSFGNDRERPLNDGSLFSIAILGNG